MCERGLVAGHGVIAVQYAPLAIDHQTQAQQQETTIRRRTPALRPPGVNVAATLRFRRENQ